MREAIQHLNRKSNWNKALIVTDSMALVESMNIENCRGVEKLSDVKDMLSEMETDNIIRERKVTLLWIPGHSGHAGNEAADKLAKLGAKMDQSKEIIEESCAIAEVKDKIKKARHQTDHHLAKEVYAKKIDMVKESSMDRRTSENLSRFRTGHHTELKHWMKLAGKSDDEKCRLCGDGEETTQHLFQDCPALDSLRQRLFQNPYPPLRTLVDDPLMSGMFVEETLRRLNFQP